MCRRQARGWLATIVMRVGGDTLSALGGPRDPPPEHQESLFHPQQAMGPERPCLVVTLGISLSVLWGEGTLPCPALGAPDRSYPLLSPSPACLRLPPCQDLKKYGATTVVRVCEVTYDKAPLEKDGITVVDWPFDDGAPPPGKVVEDWLSLLKAKFCDDPGSCVAVHCVAGLGRAPVLVALALIESGMKYEDAIQFIRQKRRGAINSKQLTYLEKYRPKQRLRFKEPHAHKTKCCVM
uniref:Protein tyrosine phosphatase type IVA 3 n=1 Tax=Suricata suricatta TaxID=37032 RepID=A0A673VCV0_SURSU